MLAEDMSVRDRFPPPWHVERTEGGFLVKARNNRTVAWIYASHSFPWSQYMRWEEAHAIAKAIARLPELYEK
jgi:hypothetical protein